MEHSKGNWKIGKQGNTIVTDNKEGFPPDNSDGRSDIDYYGGYLIAESILKKADAQLIAAAPDLLEALMGCKEALEVVSSSFGATKPFIKLADKAIKKATE